MERENLERRRFLGTMGLGMLALAGCGPTMGVFVPVPNPDPIVYDPPPPTPVVTHKPKKPTNVLDNALRREMWAEAGPITNRLNPMGGIDRITLHHSGLETYVQSTDEIIEALELYRKGHIKKFRAGDIGYHYIIDRNGNVWNGRSVRYQGAHVRDHNPHNIGVMVMGNFEVQQPTGSQISTTQSILQLLMKRHRISTSRLYSHLELSPTLCPGKFLQPKFEKIRKAMT